MKSTTVEGAKPGRKRLRAATGGTLHSSGVIF